MELHVLLPSQLARLINAGLFEYFPIYTHVLAGGQWDHIHLIGQLVLDFSDDLADLGVRPSAVDNVHSILVLRKVVGHVGLQFLLFFLRVSLFWLGLLWILVVNLRVGGSGRKRGVLVFGIPL